MPPYRGIRKGANPTYKLDPLDRKIIAVLYYMGLWTPTHIAAAYGVNRRLIYQNRDAYSDLPEVQNLPAHPMYGK